MGKAQTTVRERHPSAHPRQGEKESGKKRNLPDVSELLSQLQPLTTKGWAEETDRMMVIILATMYRYTMDIERPPKQFVFFDVEGHTISLGSLAISALVSLGDTEQDTGSDLDYRQDWNALRKAVFSPSDHTAKKTRTGKSKRCRVM